MKQQYIEIKDSILVLWPYRRLKITFTPKSEYLLNSFDYFLLESISAGYSSKQISEAILMPVSTIKNELMTLVDQKLIKCTNEGFELTDQIRKLLFVRTVSDEASKGNDEFILDCVTGIPEKVSGVFVQRGDSSIVVKGLILDKNEIFDMLSDEDFYRLNIESLKALSNEQFNLFCKSAMSRFELDNEVIYKARELYAIPSAFLNNNVTEKSSECISVASSVQELIFKVHKGDMSEIVNIFFDQSSGEYAYNFDSSEREKNKFSRNVLEIIRYYPDMETAAECAKNCFGGDDAELLSKSTIPYIAEIPISYIRSR